MEFNKKTRNIASNHSDSWGLLIEVILVFKSKKTKFKEVPSYCRLVTRHLGTRKGILSYLELILELGDHAVLRLSVLTNAPPKFPKKGSNVQVLVRPEVIAGHGCFASRSSR